MAKTLSILKPHVKTLVLDNELKERATYLDVQENVRLKDLKADVKKGAIQFQELNKLVEKEKEPKYILLTTDNLEMGYMAVEYLAAAFNHNKAGVEDKEEIPENEYCVCWEESSWRIPIIREYDLKQHLGQEEEGFSSGPFFMQGNQRLFQTKPYWMDCRNNAVCVVSNSQPDFGFGMGSTGSLQDRLNFFNNNDKVYIINLVVRNEWTDWEDDFGTEESEDVFSYNQNRGKWNSIILGFSADEVEISLKKENQKRYYKLVLQGIFNEKNLKAVKGFSYETILNLVLGMQEADKCRLLENIVNYAIKDWGNGHENVITTKDFSFMDRFVRTKSLQKGEKEKGRRTAREQLENQLIGMEAVKEQVRNVVNVMKFNRMRAKMNIKGGSYHNVHVMLGAPGTAKTTVAQLMGQIMVEEQLLPDNRFTCVNGAELKGMYVGHSAPKTKALFEENDIIVIDEAYSLVSDSGENDSFSKEAIAQLIIELENHSMDKLVIFAGYGGKKVSEKNNKMKSFLDANPGIKSRITSTIYFDSYSSKEMVEIFFQIARNQNYDVDEKVRVILEEHFSKRVMAENFGNGREARSLLETSVIFAAKRLFRQNKKNYMRSDMQTLTFEDVENAIRYAEETDEVQRGQESSKIGFLS